MFITMVHVTTFFLIAARLIGLIFWAPFFSDKQIFAMAKVALVIWASALLIFVVPMPTQLPGTNMTFFLALLMEFMIGMMLGFAASIMVIAIEFAGSLMDTQAGLSVASMLDPSTGRNAALFERMLKNVAILIFIIIDGHHMILSIFQQSFLVLPVGAPINMLEPIEFLLTLGKEIFRIGVRLAAPIILVVFIVDFAFGLLNRVAEQINIFQLGFQIKPTVSLIIILAITPALVYSILNIMEGVMKQLLELLSLMQVTI
ncbi:hypothetical protein DID80_02520 [Candidatus Marinamargulisbacteria bacterium SCGC AAA071-K20]|nr:hypothetical protein DID80_02520 [Candidatus Marinamargulisbacteria bacterium SCGC AAA071-K20]